MTAVILTSVVTTLLTLTAWKLTPRLVDWWVFGPVDGPPCLGCGRVLTPARAIVDRGRCKPCAADAAAAAAEQRQGWEQP